MASEQLEDETSLLFEISVAAPQMLIPESFTTEVASTLVVDFGHLHIRSKPNDSKDTEEFISQMKQLQVFIKTKAKDTDTRTAMVINPFDINLKISRRKSKDPHVPLATVLASLPYLSGHFSLSSFDNPQGVACIRRLEISL